MFHRVLIREEDQDSQRFLWRSLDDVKKNKQPDTYVMTVMIFGATSSPSSAIYVKNKNASLFMENQPQAAKAIEEDFYVDDDLSGGETEEAVIQLRREITEINAAGGFIVKKWNSNSQAVLQSIPMEDRAEGAKTFHAKSTIPTERVLGLRWDPSKDEFKFLANFEKVKKSLLEGDRPTKREVCSIVMALFDPIGFLNNFKVKGMMVIQQIWRSGINWDDELPDSINHEWQRWVTSLKAIEKVLIPRIYCRNLNEAQSMQLHIFMDASEEAYAAVAYLRIQDADGIKTAFVSSKARVAPMKKLTIPRLELLAAVLGTRLAMSILQELRVNIHEKYFWSDSKTVLLWIRSETLRYREFVANRIGEIHDSTNSAEWKWVPTALNVADEATRLKEPIELSSDSTWLKGPEFLLVDSEHWPKEKTLQDVPSDEDLELKPNSILSVRSEEACIIEKEMSVPVVSRFSSYHRLLRATAAVQLVWKYWKGKANYKIAKEKGLVAVKKKVKNAKDFISKAIEATTMMEAEKRLIRVVQKHSFPDELKCLQGSPGIKIRKHNILYQLTPFIDKDGIIRMKGRLENSQLDSDTKEPIILSGKHYFTELLIMREHRQNAHVGHSTVFNNLKQRFWIIGGLGAVRRVCESCQFCKNRKAKPIIPKMGSLPHYRLAAGNPPFTFTGLDFFGPLEVTVGRHHEKRWGALFTCMVTRAVHLEIAYGLSTSEMLLVLSRFVDSRGRPHHIYSDNGTNFVGSNRELKEAWTEIDWENVIQTEKFYPIQWHFLPAFAPHMGGAWERMVQSVKKVLKVQLEQKYPKDQVLMTILKGAENIVNSRPLTYASTDPNDPDSLTPNHFLRGSFCVGPSIPGSYDVKDETLRHNWKQAQAMLDSLWKRWTREYLPELNRRTKWYEDAEPLAVGDIVLLVDPGQPRNSWTKAFISAIFPGKDGQVRAVDATVRVQSGKKKLVHRRNVDTIIPLGLRMNM